MVSDQTTLKNLYEDFLKSYDEDKKLVWQRKSKEFKDFWTNKILNDEVLGITDDEIDSIVRILDFNAKGKSRGEPSVAKVMVPQGAWRRLFKEIKSNEKIRDIFAKVFDIGHETELVGLLDKLVKENQGRKNYLTGSSANVINDFLFTNNPEKYLSIVSLNDRRRIIDHFGLKNGPDFEKDSFGAKIVLSNNAILEGFRKIGIIGSPRAISSFMYSKLRTEWKPSIEVINTGEREVIVTIPEDSPYNVGGTVSVDEVETSKHIQAKICQIGEKLGFKIWIPKPDRSRVLQFWSPGPGTLLEELNVNFGGAALKTVKLIDVLWIKQRFVHNIVRAFEVEHSTSVYSGILRMADLMAVYPNLNLKTYIVAAEERKEYVFEQMTRPALKFILGERALSDVCSYLSYDSINELAENRLLGDMRETVIEQYTEDPED